jgi:hypothetical protein
MSKLQEPTSDEVGMQEDERGAGCRHEHQEPTSDEVGMQEQVSNGPAVATAPG